MGRIETNCEQTAELIGPYLDDSLPAEARRRIETHLLHCPSCSYEAATLRITKERLRGNVGEVIASDAFRVRVLSRIYSDNAHLSNDDALTVIQPEQFRLPLKI